MHFADAEWLNDPWVPRIERPPVNLETTVLVIGTGFSGIQIGGQLKKAGVDFKIMDRAGDFGGTCEAVSRWSGARGS